MGQKSGQRVKNWPNKNQVASDLLRESTDSVIRAAEGIHQFCPPTYWGNPLVDNFSIRPAEGIHRFCHRSYWGNPSILSSDLLRESIRTNQLCYVKNQRRKNGIRIECRNIGWNACGEVDIYWCSRCFLLPNICAWWPIALVALSAGHFRYNLSSCASDNPWRKYWDNWDPIVPNEKLSSCQLCNIPKSFQMRLKSLTFVVWGYLAILWTMNIQVFGTSTMAAKGSLCWPVETLHLCSPHPLPHHHLHRCWGQADLRFHHLAAESRSSLDCASSVWKQGKQGVWNRPHLSPDVL